MMQIRHIFAVIAVAGISTDAFAQFVPTRSNYLMTSFMDHPAAAGNKECLDMRMGHRNQWVGFPGAPTNSYLSLTGRIGDSPRAVQGIGVRLENDQAGVWGSTSASIAYSHKLKLSKGGWISGGFALGISQYRLSIGDLDFPDVETSGDPAVLGATSQVVFPMIDAGFWYQDKKSFGGLSLVNATSANMNELATGSEAAMVIVATGGTSLALDGNMVFRPSANIRYAKGLPACFELNGAIIFDDMISAGLGYRSQNVLVASFQLSLFNYMKVGYSYDINISNLNIVSPNSHEFTIAFSACDMKANSATACPAFD